MPRHRPNLQNADGMTTGEYFGDNGELFTITIGGKKLYILTTPEDAASVYRNNVTLSWDAMLNNLLVGFGVRASVIDQIWPDKATVIDAPTQPT